jgi:hypothetical protein
MPALADLSFEDWLEHAFGREVRFQRLEWFWDDDCDYWQPRPREAVHFLTRLFDHPAEHLRDFTDAQVAQGLNYLVNTSVGMHPDLGDRATPAAERARLWDSVETFFATYLQPRCGDHLGHLSEEGSPLSIPCYMWWEGFPHTYVLDEPDRDLVLNAEIDCLRHVAALGSAACQEAALHGLGHYSRREPAGTLATAAIDEYLERAAFARPELEAYARAARSGCIL